MKEMPLRFFFELEPGEHYRVTWAKDDDYEEGERLNYTLQTVNLNTPEGIYPTDGGYEWLRSEAVRKDLESNVLDTSRGYAYIFYP